MPWTPAVLQFSAKGGLETYNLTACYLRWEEAFNLLGFSRLVPFDDACGRSDVFTISLDPSP